MDLKFLLETEMKQKAYTLSQASVFGGFDQLKWLRTPGVYLNDRQILDNMNTYRLMMDEFVQGYWLSMSTQNVFGLSHPDEFAPPSVLYLKKSRGEKGPAFITIANPSMISSSPWPVMIQVHSQDRPDFRVLMYEAGGLATDDFSNPRTASVNILEEIPVNGDISSELFIPQLCMAFPGLQSYIRPSGIISVHGYVLEEQAYMVVQLPGIGFEHELEHERSKLMSDAGMMFPTKLYRNVKSDLDWGRFFDDTMDFADQDGKNMLLRKIDGALQDVPGERYQIRVMAAPGNQSRLVLHTAECNEGKYVSYGRQVVMDLMPVDSINCAVRQAVDRRKRLGNTPLRIKGFEEIPSPIYGCDCLRNYQPSK